MSIVKPFKGLRPKPEFAKEIASPPYDVLSVDEAMKVLAGVGPAGSTGGDRLGKVVMADGADPTVVLPLLDHLRHR